MQVNPSKATNVLFLIYDLERGGPELRLLDFANFFPDDINMHVCVTSEKLTLLEEFRTRHIKIIILPIKKAYLSIVQTLKLFYYCNKNDIKLINAFDLKSLFLAFAVKVMSCFHIKIVYHNVNSLIELSNTQFKLLSLLLKSCNSCICNSIFSKNEIEMLISTNKIHVIHNGLDPFFFKQNGSIRDRIRRSFDIQKDEIVLGIIANFRKQKNYPFLLKAFAILSEKYGKLKLLCVGGGKYLEHSKLIATEQNLEKKIVFTGYSEYVVKYLSAVDIFVLPSLWEGLPNALLQAMSMEIPVVASSVGGCSEIVHHMENGMLFLPNDIDKFTEHIETLIHDKNLACKLGHNARKTVEEEFSMDRMIMEYTTFFREFGRN